MTKKDTRNANSRIPGSGGGFNGVLAGLTGLFEKLNELAAAGHELRRSGGFETPGQSIRGIYGFTIRTGVGGEAPRVESFGNVQADAATGQAVVHEIREPLVDVFEEKDHVLIVAEMPGVGAADVRLDVRDDVLVITAERGDKKYRKEVLLPARYPRAAFRCTCNNGVVEIRAELP